MRTASRLMRALVLALAVTLLGASTALAAPPFAVDVAQNLSDELLGWATAIIIPLAALMALPALFRRDVGHALTVLVIVLIVGAFAFDPGGVEQLIKTVSDTILG